MSIRTWQRRQIRMKAAKSGVKQSRAVHAVWDRYQVAKVGPRSRMIHKAIGTAPKRKWRARLTGI